jgi:hypothetical protein
MSSDELHENDVFVGECRIGGSQIPASRLEWKIFMHEFHTEHQVKGVSP